MTPTYPCIVPDRDKRYNWYLDEDVVITLPDNSSLSLSKGFRFNGHSVPPVLRWFFPRYNTKDIYVALIHDALVNFETIHRYNRKYIDSVYKMYMNAPEYKSTKMRAFWMPLAVSVFGYLRFTLWGDYRGELKPNTRITVRIDMI